MNEEIKNFDEQPIVYGSFWERFGASFIDGLIVTPINFLLSYILTGSIC